MAASDEFCTTCSLLDVGLRRRRYDALLDEHVLPRRAPGSLRSGVPGGPDARQAQ